MNTDSGNNDDFLKEHIMDQKDKQQPFSINKDDQMTATSERTSSVESRSSTGCYESASTTPVKDPPPASSFFANAGTELKNYASEVTERISERVKAYIGPIEEAEAHTIDNKFIVRGYRINHNTCGRLIKSLCTCHNEFVNVWSHIGGVLVFIIMITVVCIDVLPN